MPNAQVHALYRLWMNIVDLHNKLRQGVVSMADAWETTDWAARHFAEGLGFWEVNVFKALIYFFPSRRTSHGDFRARLAWAFLKLGKLDYPADATAEESPGPSSGASGSLPTAPLPGGCHHYKKLPGSAGHKCAYCDKYAYHICETCYELGLGQIAVCGRKAKRGPVHCMEKHARGDAILHASWKVATPVKNKANEKRAATKAKRAVFGSILGDSSGAEASSEDSEDSDADCPVDARAGHKSPRLKKKMQGREGSQESSQGS